MRALLFLISTGHVSSCWLCAYTWRPCQGRAA